MSVCSLSHVSSYASPVGDSKRLLPLPDTFSTFAILQTTG